MTIIFSLIIIFILVGLGYFRQFKLGRALVEPMIRFSNTTGYPCSFAGLRSDSLWANKLLSVHVTCSVAEIPEKTKARNRDEFAKEIHEIVINPLRAVTPNQENLVIGFINPLSQTEVLCTALKNQKIVVYWYDSYDSYCDFTRLLQ